MNMSFYRQKQYHVFLRKMYHVQHIALLLSSTHAFKSQSCVLKNLADGVTWCKYTFEIKLHLLNGVKCSNAIFSEFRNELVFLVVQWQKFKF